MVNMTGITGVNTLQEMAAYVNTTTNGILFTGGILVFFIIILMLLIRDGQPPENAIAVASWSGFIISGVFWAAHLVPTYIPLLMLMMAGLTVLYMYTSKPRY
jgi:hypothetical protein